MAETCAVPFFVLAALAFVRAEREPPWYLALGASLSAAFLFSYAALPAAAGFAAALLATRRRDLVNREAWKAARSSPSRSAAGSRSGPGTTTCTRTRPAHDVEAMLRPRSRTSASSPSPPCPRGDRSVAALRSRRAAVLRDAGPARAVRARGLAIRRVSVAALFFFVYDWADKRFLLYALTASHVLSLAGGLAGLRSFAARGRLAAAPRRAFLCACLLWNQIRYPSYGFHYLALTPRDFLEAALTIAERLQDGAAPRGCARRPPSRLVASAFSGGLFDPRPSPCPARARTRRSRVSRRSSARRTTLLKPGEPIGFLPPKDWPGRPALQPHPAPQRLRAARRGLPRSAAVSAGGVEVVQPERTSRSRHSWPIAARTSWPGRADPTMWPF